MGDPKQTQAQDLGLVLSLGWSQVLGCELWRLGQFSLFPLPTVLAMSCIDVPQPSTACMTPTAPCRAAAAAEPKPVGEASLPQLRPHTPSRAGTSLLPCSHCSVIPCRGTTTVDGAGFGIDRPAELSKEDDEYEAFRKRMMLAYRFRPNPLVRAPPSPTLLWLGHWFLAVHGSGVAALVTEVPPSPLQLGQVSPSTPSTIPPAFEPLLPPYTLPYHLKDVSSAAPRRF